MLSNKKISSTQVATITEALDSLVSSHAAYYESGDNGKYYIHLLSNLYKTFKINLLHEISQNQYNHVLNWIQNYPPFLLQRKRRNGKRIIICNHAPERINALIKRAKEELKINRIKVLDFAYHNLKLRERIYSFNQLSESQLSQLEEALFKPKEEASR